MRIRVLQLMNNFYRDGLLPEEYDRENALGQFCILGYFDALDIETKSNGLGDDAKIWEIMSEISMSKMNGGGNVRTLVCLSLNEEKDTEFWVCKTGVPFYFVSMIRIKDHFENEEDILKKIEKLSDDSNIIGYLTYDHSEVIVVYKTNRYADGILKINFLRTYFNALKLHTIFSLRENFLKELETQKNLMVEEIISCRLRAMIKNFDKAKKFFDDLEVLMKKDNNSDMDMQRYPVLGSSDLLIEINKVKLSSLLSFYSMNSLLTHTNNAFEEAFYNIETEILISQESLNELDSE